MITTSFFEFLVPPLPYYIVCGEDTYEVGETHVERQNIEVFDMLAVTKGRLFMGEGSQTWTVNEGQALVLRPDQHHYPTKGCREETHFHWIHFQTVGIWSEFDSNPKKSEKQHLYAKAKSILNLDSPKDLGSKFTEVFSIKLPRLCTLSAPSKTFEAINGLSELEKISHFTAKYEQQALFQNILRYVHEEQSQPCNEATIKVAEKAASFFRKNYSVPFSYKQLQEELHFHPTYIARCVKKVYGCTLLEYLTKYRLQKARILLLTSNLSISSVAEKVGFYNPIYFSRCFKNAEGLSPREFRKRYRF
jgi:AraC-like DNA-binding protein